MNFFFYFISKNETFAQLFNQPIHLFMKKSLLICAFFACAISANAQLDSIIWEPFDVDTTASYALFPQGDDLGWVNFDEDGLVPDGGDEIQNQWYHGSAFVLEDSLDDNTTLRSKSWMQGFAEGNRNWLMLPPIDVTSNKFTFHWKSAPLQMFRYMDGYTILVSKSNNDAEFFTDTLFVAAQMTDITGDALIQTVENFEFSPGYIHSNGGQDSSKWTLFTEGDSSLYVGILEPHSVSLSQYAGQKIYLAVLHNSDDDNQISIDDLLVADGTVLAAKDDFEKNLRLVAYPNPATIYLNVLFKAEKAANTAKIEVFDSKGKLAMAKNLGSISTGEYTEIVPTARLSAGAYFMRLTLDGRSVSHPFLVK
jgi:Secretion system C-terminal sorting domain